MLFRSTVWGASSAFPPGFAFDGTIDAPGETLTFDAAGSNLAQGMLQWTGFSTLVYGVSNELMAPNVPTRLVLTVSDASGRLPLLSPQEAGVPSSVGGVVRFAGTYPAGAPLQVSRKMEILWGGSWQPAMAIYDGLPKPPPNQRSTPRTSFTGAFYYAP